MRVPTVNNQLLLIVLWLGLCPALKAQKTACNREVVIFLMRPSWTGATNPFGLFPVKRRVPKATPATGALKWLLAGPQKNESRRGYSGVEAEGLSIASLTIRSGIARVDFKSKKIKAWSGTLSAPRFREAVTRTLQQFPQVQQVEVWVNGDKDFYSEKG